MAKRKTSRRSTPHTAAAAPDKMLDLVHQIWLAGLGAAAKARRGTPQLFQELVAEGARVQLQTRGTAEKAVRGVIGDVQQRINAGVGQVRGQADDTLAGLEKIFRTRVHRALAQLGVPRSEEVEALNRRVQALNSNIDKLTRARKTRPNVAAARKTAGAHAAVS